MTRAGAELYLLETRKNRRDLVPLPGKYFLLF